MEKDAKATYQTMETQEEGAKREEMQKKYEERLQDAMEELFKLTNGKAWEENKGKVEKILDTVQNMAFMEGYMYAINVLEGGLVHIR